MHLAFDKGGLRFFFFTAAIRGRQLVLSSFPSDIPEFPVNWTNCHIMNDRNAALCARASEGARG